MDKKDENRIQQFLNSPTFGYSDNFPDRTMWLTLHMCSFASLAAGETRGMQTSHIAFRIDNKKNFAYNNYHILIKYAENI